MGDATSAPWLDTAGLHALLLGREATSEAQQKPAAVRYAELVAASRGTALWEEALCQQIFLGDDDFVARMLALAAPSRAQAVYVPRSIAPNTGALNAASISG